jgi:predicted nucleic acid-binding protein
MMKANAIQITGYAFRNTDRLFLDANVWMYIYGPPGNPRDWKTGVYSRAFSDALKAGSQLHIDALILSEFVNRYARLEHKNMQIRVGAIPADFKIFRNTPAFVSIAQSIAQDARRILKACIRVESDFTGVDISQIFVDFELGNYDFNDQILSALCKKSDYVLMTHDIDFSEHDVTVLSANPKFFPAHP